MLITSSIILSVSSFGPASGIPENSRLDRLVYCSFLSACSSSALNLSSSSRVVGLCSCYASATAVDLSDWFDSGYMSSDKFKKTLHLYLHAHNEPYNMSA